MTDVRYDGDIQFWLEVKGLVPAIIAVPSLWNRVYTTSEGEGMAGRLKKL